MCGIAGIVAGDPSTVRSALAAMVAAQVHRGPDDVGEAVVPFGQRFLGLGHRRLSILDLSSAGHQPMVNPETGDQIIFNGEIYNFKTLARDLAAEGIHLRGQSDTEVLLHGLSLWGTDLISRLEGMFAFAFYNARDHSILLARDPAGIKPLYVAHIPGGLVFASEVRAVLASGVVPKEWDMQGIAALLAYGAPQQPNTVFASIKSFPAGCFQTINPRQIARMSSPQRYWTYPACDERLDETHAIEAIRSTMEESVRDHLVADVPVGVFLSSGIDSTIVGTLAGKFSPHIRAFTVGFADQPDMSEAPLAAETAKLAGLRHTDVQITGTDAEAACAHWLAALDQPSMDGLNTYVISQAVRKEGITVALSGQGGDELFGGYPSFVDVPRLVSMLRLISWMPMPLRKTLFRTASFRKSEAVRQKLLDIIECKPRVLELYLQRRRAMSNSQLASLGITPQTLGLNDAFLSEACLDGLRFDGDPTADISRLESHFFQGNMLLRDVDANSMAHSLEIRVPILDKRVLDLACRIPGEVRLPPRGRPKHLLRTAFEPMFRPSLMQQKKKGFTLPIRRWMHGPLRELCEASLRHLKSSEMLHAEGVDSVWKTFLKQPESPIWSRAFVLCVLGHYMKKMDAAPVSHPPANPVPSPSGRGLG